MQYCAIVSRRRATVFALISALLVALSGCKSEPPKPGQKAFEAANDKVAMYEGEVGFGSDATAQALAKAFATRIKALEAESFTGGENDDDSITTKGHWLSYCHTTADAIVLLVQPPHLDNYEGSDRKALLELAWEAAEEVSAKSRGKKSLTVALRGKFLYGAMAHAAAGAKPKLETGMSLDVAPLYGHFAPAAK